MGAENHLDDKEPFGSFNRKVLTEDTPGREYAITGSPVKTDQIPGEEKPTIDRVEFDFSQFENNIETSNLEEEEIEGNAKGELSQTEYNKELGDPDEVALNKKVQAKLAKGQAKNIAGIYVMILKAAWKWIGKYREDKLQIMHIRGEIDINIIIRDHPFIQHIREMNNEVDEWELDGDAIEAIVDALEIYLISQNIQNSPGMNLAMAMGVPAIEMLAKAWGHKREMKSLVQAVSEMHQNNKTTARKQQIEISKANSLQELLAEERAKNQELINASEKIKEVSQQVAQRVAPKRTPSKPKTENPFKPKKHDTPVVASDESMSPKKPKDDTAK